MADLTASDFMILPQELIDYINNERKNFRNQPTLQKNPRVPVGEAVAPLSGELFYAHNFIGMKDAAIQLYLSMIFGSGSSNFYDFSNYPSAYNTGRFINTIGSDLRTMSTDTSVCTAQSLYDLYSSIVVDTQFFNDFIEDYLQHPSYVTVPRVNLTSNSERKASEVKNAFDAIDENISNLFECARVVPYGFNISSSQFALTQNYTFISEDYEGYDPASNIFFSTNLTRSGNDVSGWASKPILDYLDPKFTSSLELDSERLLGPSGQSVTPIIAYSEDATDTENISALIQLSEGMLSSGEQGIIREEYLGAYTLAKLSDIGTVSFENNTLSFTPNPSAIQSILYDMDDEIGFPSSLPSNATKLSKQGQASARFVFFPKTP